MVPGILLGKLGLRARLHIKPVKQGDNAHTRSDCSCYKGFSLLLSHVFLITSLKHSHGIERPRPHGTIRQTVSRPMWVHLHADTESNICVNKYPIPVPKTCPEFANLGTTKVFLTCCVQGSLENECMGDYLLISIKRAYREEVGAIEVNSTKNQSCTDMSLILEQVGFEKCQSCYNTRPSASAISVQFKVRSNHACE